MNKFENLIENDNYLEKFNLELIEAVKNQLKNFQASSFRFHIKGSQNVC